MKIQGLDENAYLAGGNKPGLELEVLAQPEDKGQKGYAVVARYEKFPLFVEVVTTKGYEGLYSDRKGLPRYMINTSQTWGRLTALQASDLAHVVLNAVQIVEHLMRQDDLPTTDR